MTSCGLAIVQRLISVVFGSLAAGKLWCFKQFCDALWGLTPNPPTPRLSQFAPADMMGRHDTSWSPSLATRSRTQSTRRRVFVERLVKPCPGSNRLILDFAETCCRTEHSVAD